MNSPKNPARGLITWLTLGLIAGGACLLMLSYGLSVAWGLFELPGVKGLLTRFMFKNFCVTELFNALIVGFLAGVCVLEVRETVNKVRGANQQTRHPIRGQLWKSFKVLILVGGSLCIAGALAIWLLLWEFGDNIMSVATTAEDLVPRSLIMDGGFLARIFFYGGALLGRGYVVRLVDHMLDSAKNSAPSWGTRLGRAVVFLTTDVAGSFFWCLAIYLGLFDDHYFIKLRTWCLEDSPNRLLAPVFIIGSAGSFLLCLGLMLLAFVLLKNYIHKQAALLNCP